jgi:hypothetical protein
MHAEITNLIGKTDRSLASFRLSWLNSRTHRAASGWLTLIDELLELRMGLMAMRDKTTQLA